MNTFKDREKSFEKKFANDQEAEFKINAKRNKLLASWVADILKLNDEQKKIISLKLLKQTFKSLVMKMYLEKLKKI